MGSTATQSRDRADKVRFSLASAALLGVVLGPLRQNWRSTPRDGFPLSYYPMFTAKRRRHGSVTYLLGTDANGERRLLHYSYLGGGGLNQVRRQLRRIVAEGRADEAAAIVAAALEATPRRRDRYVTRVHVVTGRYRYGDFFAGQRDPASEVVHSTAAVDKRGTLPRSLDRQQHDEAPANEGMQPSG